MISKVSLIMFGLALVLAAEARGGGEWSGRWGNGGSDSQEQQGSGGGDGGYGGSDSSSQDESSGGWSGRSGQSSGGWGQSGSGSGSGSTNDQGQISSGWSGRSKRSASRGGWSSQGQSSGGWSSQQGSQGGQSQGASNSGRHGHHHGHHGNGSNGMGGGRMENSFNISQYVSFENCDNDAPVQIEDFQMDLMGLSGLLVSSAPISSDLYFNLNVSIDQPQYNVEIIKNLGLSSFPVIQSLIPASSDLNQTFHIPPMHPMLFQVAQSKLSSSQIDQIKSQLANATITTTFLATDASNNNVACFQINQKGSFIAKAMSMFGGRQGGPGPAAAASGQSSDGQGQSSDGQGPSGGQGPQGYQGGQQGAQGGQGPQGYQGGHGGQSLDGSRPNRGGQQGAQGAQGGQASSGQGFGGSGQAY